MKRVKIVCLMLVSMVWNSCMDHIVYHSYHHFPKEGWSKSDTITLHLHIADYVPSNTKITFLIRNQSSYPYQDFNAMVFHNMPDSVRWRSYKLNFILADKDGRWNGDGWGGLYQSSVSLGNTYVSSGNYTFKVVHHMKDEQLLGINDIGILVEKEAPITK